jgi:hypothetical protein
LFLAENEDIDDLTEDNIEEYERFLTRYINDSQLLAPIDSIDDIFNSIDVLKDDLENELIDLESDDNIEEPELEPRYIEIQGKLAQLNNLNSLKTKYTKQVSSFSRLESNTSSLPYLLNRFFIEYLANGISIVNNSYEFGALKEDLAEEIPTVKAELEKAKIALLDIKDKSELENLQPLLESKVTAIVKQLEEILQSLLNQAQSRAAFQERIELDKVVSIKSLFEDSEIKSILLSTLNLQDKDLELIYTDDYAYYKLLHILDQLKDNKAFSLRIETLYRENTTRTASAITSFPSIIENYVTNPNYLLSQIVYYLFPDQFKSTTAWAEFQTNLDILKLESHLEKSNFSDIPLQVRDNVANSFREFMKQHKYNLNLRQIITTNNSSLKLKDLTEAEVKMSTTEKSPTFQQKSLIHEILNWFTIKNSNILYSNAATIKGIIGTGKTKVVLNNLVKLGIALNLFKEDEVILLGHNTTTTDQLNDVIFGKKGVHTISSILSNLNSLDNKKLIVLDESLAVTNDEVANLVNEANKKGIKVILAGDESQNRSGVVHVAATEKHVYHTAPLSIVYRTNIASITNAALAFKDKLNPVGSVDFTSNKATVTDLKNDPSTALGVKEVSETDVVEILKRPSARKRILIVANDAEVIRYQQLGLDPNVRVLNYVAVQGIEAEEVYIAINNSQRNAYNTVFTQPEYNTALYTSIGRAIKFAGVVTFGYNADSLHSDTLEADANSLAEDFKIIKEEYVAGLNSLASLFNITPVVVATPQTTVVAQNPVIEEESAEEESEVIEDTEEPIPTEPMFIPPLTVDGEEHFIMYPDNDLLSSPENSNIDYSTYYILRSTTSDLRLLVAKDKNYNSNNLVYPVAVLGKEEFEDSTPLGKHILKNDLLSKPVYNIDGFTPAARRGFEAKNLDSIAMASFKAGTVNSKLKIHMPDGTKNPLSLNTIIPKFFTEFFTGAKGLLNLIPSSHIFSTYLNGPINWSKATNNQDPDISVVIYDAKQVKDIGLKNFKLQVGVPYLRIDNISWEAKRSASKGHQPIFIRLDPKQYNSNLGIDYIDTAVNRITEFYKAFTQVKSIFPEFKLNDRKIINGVVKEGQFDRLLDAYAKKAYEIKITKNDKNEFEYSVNKANKFDFNTFSELNFTNVDLQKLEDNLDIIVPLVYGSSVSNKYITFAEYKQLLSKDAAAVGQFVPSVKLKEKQMNLYLTKNPNATIEDIQKELQLEDNSKVLYYEKDAAGQGTLAQAARVTRSAGPIQKDFDLIASANAQLSMTIERNKVESGKKFSYRAAKSLFATGLVDFQTKKDIKTLLEKSLQDVLFRALGDEKTNEALNALKGSMSSWESDELLDGTTYDESNIDFIFKTDGTLSFATQNSETKRETPLALVLVVDAIVNSVAANNPSLLSVFGSLEAAQEWKANLEIEALNLMNRASTNGMTEKDIEQLLENNNGQYNFRIPIVRNAKKIDSKFSNSSVRNFGKLHTEADRNLAEKLFETQFTGVTASKLSIQIPKETEVKQTSNPIPVAPPQMTDQEKLNLGLDPNNRGKSVKLSDLDIN